MSRGTDADRRGAERASGGDGDEHQEVLGGAGAAAGSQRWAGLWERGEEQLHLGAHRCTEQTKGAPGAAEEEEEAQRRCRGVAGENAGISECFIPSDFNISTLVMFRSLQIFLFFYCLLHFSLYSLLFFPTNWILLKSFPIFVSLPGFLPPQRFSVEGLSSVIQNSFRQTFGSGCSERQVIFYFCSTSSYCFLDWKYALCQECHPTETPTTEPSSLVFVFVLQYLTTVIPYEKKGHPPSLEDLQILTKSKCLHNNSTWVILAATDPLTLLYLLPFSSSSYERRQWQGAQSLDRLHSQRWAFLICFNWSLWHDVLSVYALSIMFDRSQKDQWPQELSPVCFHWRDQDLQ